LAARENGLPDCLSLSLSLADACNPLLQAHPSALGAGQHEGRGFPLLFSPLCVPSRADPSWLGHAATIYSSVQGPPGVKTPTRVFTNPAGGPWLHRVGRLQAVSCSVSGPLGLDGSGAASDAASRRLVGAWLPIHRMGDSRVVRGFGTSMASPARRAHWGTIQDVVRRDGGDDVLGWSCPHSCWSNGSENPFVRAEAAAAHRCRGGHRRW
jgi:hypothetical protein